MILSTSDTLRIASPAPFLIGTTCYSTTMVLSPVQILT